MVPSAHSCRISNKTPPQFCSWLMCPLPGSPRRNGFVFFLGRDSWVKDSKWAHFPSNKPKWKNNSDGSHKHTFPCSASCGQRDLKISMFCVILILLFQREIPTTLGVLSKHCSLRAWPGRVFGPIPNSTEIIVIAKLGRNQYSHHSLHCDFTDFLLKG